MRVNRGTGTLLLLLGAAALGGCSEGGLAGTLRSAGVGSTPDEFLVLPTQPLEIPANLASLPLPPPAPGTANRVDVDPEVVALVGLTGQPPSAGGASGAVLVASAGGADPAIRSQLAQEDAEYRGGNRGLLLERVFASDQEALTYRGMILDAPDEFGRLRAAGTAVPPASPKALDQRAGPVEPEANLRRRGWRVLPPTQ